MKDIYEMSCRKWRSFEHYSNFERRLGRDETKTLKD